VNSVSSAGKRILALGDSYTIGEAVGAEERWPVVMAAGLRSGGIDVEETRIIAQTGWTTTELSAAIDDAKPKGPFDLVTLLVGVNDQYRGGSAADYRPQFAALLQRAMGFAGDRASRVIVLSIPDWGVTPFAAGRDAAAIARAIDAFNAVNRAESERVKARYVDVTPISRRARAEPKLIAADGLHPSAAMYREWVSLVLPAARDGLRGG
jgi:lysophospholipase L1-like esterase